ncbi:hypothetical protein D9611_014129 [Ephemerocybe angulata]|uniref:Uncharacterized protein n=1 Tax=Ephemerocybe angulata TaxID=980116 RepID=A0A8H5B9G0_9AGAR|nr:hypothetical protein D9611_014129 [Tulosesus angulatus]
MVPASRLEILDAQGLNFQRYPHHHVAGLLGYVETHHGLRTFLTIWANHLSDEVKHHFYKNGYHSKKKAFTSTPARTTRTEASPRLTKWSASASTAPSSVPSLTPSQKKAHLFKIQHSRGSIAGKVDFSYKLMEIPLKGGFIDDKVDPIPVSSSSSMRRPSTSPPRLSVTNSKVLSPLGNNKLPRKPPRLRKVACIGAWHPSKVILSVAYAGQTGASNSSTNKRPLPPRHTGGSTAGKVDFGYKLTEIQLNSVLFDDNVVIDHELIGKPIEVSSVFEQEENLNCTAAIKLHRLEGVITAGEQKASSQEPHGSARSLVSEHGILPRSCSPLHVLVKDGSTTYDSNESTEQERYIIPMGGFTYYSRTLRTNVLIVRASLPRIEQRMIAIRTLRTVVQSMSIAISSLYSLPRGRGITQRPSDSLFYALDANTLPSQRGTLNASDPTIHFRFEQIAAYNSCQRVQTPYHRSAPLGSQSSPKTSVPSVDVSFVSFNEPIGFELNVLKHFIRNKACRLTRKQICQSLPHYLADSSRYWSRTETTEQGAREIDVVLSSLMTKSFESVNPGIFPCSFNQAKEAKLAEKKTPSTHTNATRRSAKERVLSIIHFTAQMFLKAILGTSIDHRSKDC